MSQMRLELDDIHATRIRGGRCPMCGAKMRKHDVWMLCASKACRFRVEAEDWHPQGWCVIRGGRRRERE